MDSYTAANGYMMLSLALEAIMMTGEKEEALEDAVRDRMDVFFKDMTDKDRKRSLDGPSRLVRIVDLPPGSPKPRMEVSISPLVSCHVKV